MNDLSLGAHMARGYSKRHPITGVLINREVWTTNSWGEVRAEIKSLMGMQHLTWMYSNYEPGTIIMLSRAGRNELELDKTIVADLAKASRQADQLKVLRHGVQAGSPSWLQQYKQLISKPEEAVTSGKMNIDIFLKWLKAFHLLQPIKNAKFQKALIARLKNDGCPLGPGPAGHALPHHQQGEGPHQEQDLLHAVLVRAVPLVRVVHPRGLLGARAGPHHRTAADARTDTYGIGEAHCRWCPKDHWPRWPSSQRHPRRAPRSGLRA